MTSLRAVREARGWSLREVEIVTGMPFGSLARAERGVRVLSGEEMIRLVRAFGLTKDDAHEIIEFGAEVPA